MNGHLHDISPDIVTCAFLAFALALVSFFLSLITSEKYAWMVGLNATFVLLASAICSVRVLFTLWAHGPVLIGIEWFRIAEHSLSADLLLTQTSALMMTVVSVISFLVHLFSAGYMAGDGSFRKYFAMLGFFTFSMQGIVLADNLLMIFIFWELVGFASYMLVGHWMEKPAAARAAKRAFIFNRIGDIGFLVGLMVIWSPTGSFSLTALVGHPAHSWQTIATLCLFGGVIGKSAQFPLFPWLADAMEGPTPVSALIHAATMVAAGVYLLLRLFPLFTPESLNVIAWIGMITAVMGALAALFNFDFKRILAYSTISQLGLMVMAIGLGLWDAALLHLLTHAFFKAGLFLCAGAIIYSIHMAQLRTHTKFDAQDIRNLGGLRRRLPVIFVSFLIAAASLSGIPFFSGFLSKEAILASLWMTSGTLSGFMFAAMLAVSFLTVLYSFRMIWFIFLSEPRNTITPLVVDAPAIMRIPAMALALLSLWFIVSWNPFHFAGWLWPAERDFADLSFISLLSIVWVAVALLVSHRIYRRARFDRISVLENAFYLDRFYDRAVGRMILAGSVAANHVDRKWIDGFVHATAYAQVTLAHVVGWIDKVFVDGTVAGISRVVSATGVVTRSFQGGKIQVYIFWAILAIIIFLIWMLE